MTFADPMDLKSKQEPLQNRHVLLVSPSPVHGCILVIDCDTFIGLGDRATVEPIPLPTSPLTFEAMGSMIQFSPTASDSLAQLGQAVVPDASHVDGPALLHGLDSPILPGPPGSP
jgi:hypothetical protein